MSKRDNHFQHLVLHGIWLVIRLLVDIRRRQGGAGCGAVHQEDIYRGNLIDFGDLYGPQHEGAMTYRREHTYAGLPK